MPVQLLAITTKRSCFVLSASVAFLAAADGAVAMKPTATVSPLLGRVNGVDSTAVRNALALRTNTLTEKLSSRSMCFAIFCSIAFAAPLPLKITLPLAMNVLTLS